MGWHVSVDRGGTFADVVARDPEGVLHVRKLLARGAVEVEAIEALLPAGAVVDELRVGTTVATNALLTGALAPAALVVTRGLGDLPRIRDQQRPDLFALHPSRPGLGLAAVVELGERIDADGQVLVAPDLAGLAAELEVLRSVGVESIAVALLNAWRNDSHERAVAGLARELGFTNVHTSADVAPGVGLVERLVTVATDAQVTPALRRYLDELEQGLPPRTRLLAMRSWGGLGGASSLRGVQAVLSGPAGGVVACASIARRHGLPAVLGFDMGGTSTDVCRFAGELERARRLEVPGRSLRVPALDVVTVAAGGGSVLGLRDGRFRAGPASAGASPGPAAYGLGGPPTVTDANVVLGRLQPDLFPSVFGPSGEEPLDPGAARAALARLGPAAASADAAGGFVAVANETMAAAIAELSASRGHDPALHTLVPLGGAAGQHACAIAERLGIDAILMHPLASVLSAWGIANAERVAVRSEPVMQPWADELPAALAPRVEALVRACLAELEGTGPAEQPRRRVRLDLAYVGSVTALEAADRSSFEAAHRRLFGFARPDTGIEVRALRVEVSTGSRSAPSAPPTPATQPPPPPFARRRVGFPDRFGDVAWHDCPVHRLESLPAGTRLEGPALLAAENTTVLVDPGWRAEIQADRTLRLVGVGSAPHRATARRDPVRLELYHRRFMSVAARMGETLRRVAWSVNIAERLDFSCAVFDSRGGLVANAPHIPVHLGAMGDTVAGMSGRLGARMAPGTAWASNDPLGGGSHLPDITVVSPVFAQGRLVAFVASRAHHADVGGLTPGSMPPDSTSRCEEGVVLDDLCLLADGRWQGVGVDAALSPAGHPWPPRSPATCRADLQAQVACNGLGVALLGSMFADEGAEVVTAWMGHVQDNGAEAVQAWLERLGDASRSFSDALDDGTVLAVRLLREGPPGARRLVVDFAGTGPRSAGNLNAPRAVVRAAVLYCIRCALGHEIPLNAGCLRAVELRIPAGSLLDPGPDSAVVGGNVETSQRLVDVLLGALGLAAASQGTMNNLTFGGAGFTYYETIAGGGGAGDQAPGAFGLQAHMTNTRITDPEILELRQPVQLLRFAGRPGSGGAGRWPGGDGLVRELRFTAAGTASLLSERRARGPFGLAGGQPGAPGRAALRRADGGEDQLGGRFTIAVEPGDCLRIETPGGGGFGPPDLADM